MELLCDSPLPAEATIALLLGCDQGRAYNVAVEIEQIERGLLPPIQVDIDQYNAFVMISYLESARAVAGAGAPSDAIIRRFIEGLEACLARDCPELAAVLADARQRKGGR